MIERFTQEREQLLGKLSHADSLIREAEEALRVHEQNKWALIGAIQLLDKMIGEENGSNPGLPETGSLVGDN